MDPEYDLDTRTVVDVPNRFVIVQIDGTWLPLDETHKLFLQADGSILADSPDGKTHRFESIHWNWADPE